MALHPILSEFQKAQGDLQAAFQAIAPPTHSIYVEAISSLDMFYTDGDAMRYTGKITVQINPHGITHSWYFTPEGPVDHFPEEYDTVFRAWITAVVGKAR
jgi:hypothetical protein